jgi:thiosulfate/3-mercaptopyruvate sulfurtransferase
MDRSRRLTRRNLCMATVGLAAAAALGGCGSLTSAVPAMPLDAFPGNGPVPLAVDSFWLRDRLSNDPSSVKIVDVSQIRHFRREHINGATHSWWRDTVDPNYPVFGAVLTQGENNRFRQEFVERLEIRTGQHVVVYDDSQGFRAARIVWFLRFLGYDRVSMLSGGLASWKSVGTKPGDAEADNSGATVNTVSPRDGYYVVTEQLITRLSDPSTQLVDMRTNHDRTNDLTGQLPIGMIPGSIHLPWSETLADEAGQLKSLAELQAFTENLDITPERPTVVYGLFGVDAAHTWLVLKLLGFELVEIYDRGWVEWSSRDDLEIAPFF